MTRKAPLLKALDILLPQEELGSDFQKVLYDNRGDLYVSDNPMTRKEQAYRRGKCLATSLKQMRTCKFFYGGLSRICIERYRENATTVLCLSYAAKKGGIKNG